MIESIESRKKRKYASGTIFKYNELWKSGAHYDYRFFKLSHYGPKGKPMGHYLNCTKHYVSFDQTKTRVVFKLNNEPVSGRAERLRHPLLWEECTEYELSNGIGAENVVS